VEEALGDPSIEFTPEMTAKLRRLCYDGLTVRNNTAHRGLIALYSSKWIGILK
jgi:hypothetical protein